MGAFAGAGLQRHKLFLSWAGQFGAIFRVQFGLHDAVVISDPAEWQKLLAANGAFNKWGLLYKARIVLGALLLKPHSTPIQCPWPQAQLKKKGHKARPVLNAPILCRALNPQLPSITPLSAPQTQRSGATSGGADLHAVRLPTLAMSPSGAGKTLGSARQGKPGPFSAHLLGASPWQRLPSSAQEHLYMNVHICAELRLQQR